MIFTGIETFHEAIYAVCSKIGLDSQLHLSHEVIFRQVNADLYKSLERSQAVKVSRWMQTSKYRLYM